MLDFGQVWRLVMNVKTKALIEQARQLSPEERIELIEDLQSSLDPLDPEIDRLWAAEARDRLSAYLRSELQSRSFDDILQKYKRS